GPARHVVLLSAGTQARYPNLLVAGSVQRGEADMSGFARERGVAFLSIPELGRTLHPLNDVVALWKLWRLCRTARPHIVHTHTAKAGTLGRLAAWLAGVPVRVHTFHGHVFHGYFGRLKTLFFITVERALARITTKFVAISPRQAKDVARYLRLPPYRVGVIPLGLDLDRLLKADAELERQRFRDEIGARSDVVVPMVGRLTATRPRSRARCSPSLMAPRGSDSGRPGARRSASRTECSAWSGTSSGCTTSCSPNGPAAGWRRDALPGHGRGRVHRLASGGAPGRAGRERGARARQLRHGEAREPRPLARARRAAGGQRRGSRRVPPRLRRSGLRAAPGRRPL